VLPEEGVGLGDVTREQVVEPGDLRFDPGLVDPGRAGGAPGVEPVQALPKGLSPILTVPDQRGGGLGHHADEDGHLRCREQLHGLLRYSHYAA
jgi:hypothetical protein